MPNALKSKSSHFFFEFVRRLQHKRQSILDQNDPFGRRYFCKHWRRKGKATYQCSHHRLWYSQKPEIDLVDFWLAGQVYCIFLFLSAASLFGTIIAQVNEIVADLTTKKKDLDSILENYLSVNPRSEMLTFAEVLPNFFHNNHDPFTTITAHDVYLFQTWCQDDVRCANMGKVPISSGMSASSGEWSLISLVESFSSWHGMIHRWRGQNQTILQRHLPVALKLSIAKKIENNLFSKVNKS